MLASITDNSLDVVKLENFSEEEENINGCSFVWGLVQTASTEAVDHEAWPQ